MKGLIVKDILVLRSKMKVFPFVILILLSGLALYFFGSTGVLILDIFLPIYFCALTIPVFQEDDKVGWNTYVSASPLSKKVIVISRYIISFSIIAAIAFVLLIANLIYSFFSDFSILVHLSTLLLSIFIGFIYLSLLIPSIYYSGSNGASTVMLFAILVMSLLTFLINSKKFNINAILDISPLFLIAAMVLFLCGIIYLSFLTSLKIFTKSLTE
ncbi:ABC-2 transporter permease [Caldifermentibacillus hisashii]|uniref:ABC-2 transporter permease n=1 Tax=Bacillaceae TaxID=186817 RepID=UPI001D05F330|nr:MULTISPECIES: ABC-2 transporter permease [Caldibacillus]MCB7069232.1 ABC-2 transporter permease [Caldibacillus sp. 210928-DFI.2.22]MCB7072656.1 ABC-2 transporter permease [Caldibacillus sp. 210928-DFI.2.18]MCM3053740.1 ABC-2 transporter permease [Caldibacillus thermoamylovorans]